MEGAIACGVESRDLIAVRIQDHDCSGDRLGRAWVRGIHDRADRTSFCYPCDAGVERTLPIASWTGTGTQHDTDQEHRCHPDESMSMSHGWASRRSCGCHSVASYGRKSIVIL